MTNPWPAFNIQRVAFSSANTACECNTPHHAAPLTTTPRELGRDSVSGGLVGGPPRLATHYGTLVMREDSLMGTRWTRRRRVHGRPTSCILIRRLQRPAIRTGTRGVSCSTATCILQRLPVITIITGAGRAGLSTTLCTCQQGHTPSADHGRSRQGLPTTVADYTGRCHLECAQRHSYTVDCRHHVWALASCFGRLASSCRSPTVLSTAMTFGRPWPAGGGGTRGRAPERRPRVDPCPGGRGGGGAGALGSAPPVFGHGCGQAIGLHVKVVDEVQASNLGHTKHLSSRGGGGSLLLPSRRAGHRVSRRVRGRLDLGVWGGGGAVFYLGEPGGIGGLRPGLVASGLGWGDKPSVGTARV